jgi:hypothetical protein
VSEAHVFSMARVEGHACKLGWCSYATLAEKYGISDVGLAKNCRKLSIPLPGRGYWAKMSSTIGINRDEYECVMVGGQRRLDQC